MNIEGIINVAGKPGLYKVISKSNNTVLISIEKKKKKEVKKEIKK